MIFFNQLYRYLKLFLRIPEIIMLLKLLEANQVIKKKSKKKRLFHWEQPRKYFNRINLQT